MKENPFPHARKYLNKDSDTYTQISKEISLLEARFLLRLGRNQEALALLTELWSNDNKIRHAALMLSEAHFNLAKGKDNEITHQLNQALKFADTALALSTRTYKRKGPDGKEIEVKKTIFPKGYNQRARVRMRQKNFLDANYDLIEAIDQDYDFAEAHFNRGVCLAELSSKYISDLKKHESYRKQLIQEIEELSKLDRGLSRRLRDEFYTKGVKGGGS